MTAEERYESVCESLLQALRPRFGGQSNPLLVDKVRRLAREAIALGKTGYIKEKAGSMVGWVEIACSPRRHKPWGLERVEHFAYEDAYRLRYAFPDQQKD